MEQSDEQLLRQFCAGNDGAFEVLVERYKSPLLGFLVRMVGERALAEELLQEAFLRTCRYAERFDPSKKLSSWVYRIARNLALTALEQRQREGRAVGAQGFWESPALTPADPAGEAERREGALKVEKALAELDPDHRAVVLMKHFQAMTHAEIAAAMGCPVGTVKSRLHYALAQLRQKLLASQSG